MLQYLFDDHLVLNEGDDLHLAPAFRAYYLSDRGLGLAYVTNTHEHPDHTPGNSRLLEKIGATGMKPMDATAKKYIKI